MVAADTKAIDALLTDYCVLTHMTGYPQPNARGLTACRAAYESGDAWLDALREHIAAARAHVEARLERIEGIEAAPCEGTYLLWLDCSGFLKAAGLEPERLDEVMLNEAGLWLDDGPALFQVRRTRAGDAWERRQAEACATPEPDTAPVSLGLPTLRVGAPI